MSMQRSNDIETKTMKDLNIQEIKNQIINAKNEIELRNIVENIPLRANRAEFRISRILADAFWHNDLNTFELKQKFMISKL